MPTSPSLLAVAATIAAENAVRYGVAASIGWFGVHKLLGRRLWARKVLQRGPDAGQVRREVLWSLASVLVYGVVGAATVAAARAGWTRMYWSVAERGWVWFVASFAVVVLVHDAWFYWTHRAMHHPRLFRVFHRTHHLSTNPTAWAAYAFSPWEAAVQAGIFPLVAFTLPVHPLAFLAFMVWQVGFNVLGHQGYELYPRSFLADGRGRTFNTTTHHALHHERFTGNYSLYFQHWDRWCGTNLPEYRARFEEVVERVAVSGATSAPVQMDQESE